MLACIPMSSYAEKKIYVDHDTTSDPSGPKRGPETDIVTISVNEGDCELYVTCNDNVSGLHVTLARNGTWHCYGIREQELDSIRLFQPWQGFSDYARLRQPHRICEGADTTSQRHLP